jgi:hypothetical protein
MELKDIVNLLDENELEALESIGYEDADVLRLVFTISCNNEETETIELTYCGPNDFTLSGYMMWEREKSDYIDHEGFYFITKVLQKLASKDLGIEE